MEQEQRFDANVWFDRYADMHKENHRFPNRWSKEQLKAVYALACAIRDCKYHEVI